MPFDSCSKKLGFIHLLVDSNTLGSQFLLGLVDFLYTHIGVSIHADLQIQGLKPMKYSTQSRNKTKGIIYRLPKQVWV